MFWFKKKNKEIAEVNEEIDISVVPPPDKVNVLRLRRDVLEWKDKHILQIEMHLRRELICLMTDIDHQLEKISMADTLFNLKKVNSNVIQPLFESWVSRESIHLVEEAQRELALIHNMELEGQGSNRQNNIDTQHSNDHLLDAGSAVVLGLGSLAAIPTLSTLSVTTAGGWLGLFAVSTVSVPVLGVGILAVGSLVALSGYKMSGVKARAIKNSREKSYEVIKKFVLPNIDEAETNKSTSPKALHPTSLCEVLQSRIQATSDKIIGELN